MPTNLLIRVDGNDWNIPTRIIMVNEKVEVSYTNMTTGNGEWIGLFKPGDGYAQFTSYKVLSSESGSFTVKMQPIAGQYELRMYDNTNKLLLKSPIMTVIPPPTQTPLPTATPTITPAPTMAAAIAELEKRLENQRKEALTDEELGRSM